MHLPNLFTGTYGDETIYGFSELRKYVNREYCCSVHRSVEDVIGPVGLCYPGVAGRHPAFAATPGNPTACVADDVTLARDLKFAMAVVDGSIVGFQFNTPRILSGTRRYATGAVAGAAAFGRGYCYLMLVRPELRFRIARILGPAPLVSDFAQFYRVAGLDSHGVEFVQVGEGLWHCKESHAQMSGRQVWWELMALRGDDGRGRLGVEKELCMVCGYTVNPVDHEKRCRRPAPYDEASAWVGDSLHALDVSRVIAHVLPSTVNRAELRMGYVSASAQREYLMHAGCCTDTVGWSDRDWSNWFEDNYRIIRFDYCNWIVDDVVFTYGSFENGTVLTSHLLDKEVPVVKSRSLSAYDFEIALVDLLQERVSGKIEVDDSWIAAAEMSYDIRRLVASKEVDLFTIKAQPFVMKSYLREFLVNYLVDQNTPQGLGKSLVDYFFRHYTGKFRWAFLTLVASELADKDGTRVRVDSVS